MIWTSCNCRLHIHNSDQVWHIAMLTYLQRVLYSRAVKRHQVKAKWFSRNAFNQHQIWTLLNIQTGSQINLRTLCTTFICWQTALHHLFLQKTTFIFVAILLTIRKINLFQGCNLLNISIARQKWLETWKCWYFRLYTK